MQFLLSGTVSTSQNILRLYHVSDVPLILEIFLNYMHDELGGGLKINDFLIYFHDVVILVYDLKVLQNR